MHFIPTLHMHLIWGREKVEKLFILEEIASLVLDVAPLQRSRKLKEELKQWVVAALEIKSTQTAACVTNINNNHS